MSPYICQKRSLFGGFKNFIGSQTIWKYYVLPAHDEIKITFDMYGFGDWSSNNLKIYFDDDLKRDINFNDILYLNNFCGEINVQGFQTNFVINDDLHIQSNFKLKIESYGSNSNAWWGIRNLLIFIVNKCPTLCLSCDDKNICSDFVQFAFQADDKSVQCRDGFFLDFSNKQCSLCHAICKTCFDGTENGCLSCFIADSFNINTCEKSTCTEKKLIN